MPRRCRHVSHTSRTGGSPHSQSGRTRRLAFTAELRRHRGLSGGREAGGRAAGAAVEARAPDHERKEVPEERRHGARLERVLQLRDAEAPCLRAALDDLAIRAVRQPLEPYTPPGTLSRSARQSATAVFGSVV